jgi:hypothetical protein
VIGGARVAGVAVSGTDAETFCHARPVPLEEHVGLGDQPQHEVPARGALEVSGHRTAAAQLLVSAVVTHPRSA